MEAWPPEEVFGRPLATLVLAFGLAALAPRLLHRLAALGPADDRASVVGAACPWVLTFLVALAAVAGFTAFGPALTPAPGGLAGALFAAVSVALVLVGYRIGGGALPRGGHPVGHLLGVSVVSVGLVAAAVPVLVTAIAPGDVLDVSAAHARWRVRLHPWDPNAMLAEAWHSRRRGESERAALQADDALRAGAPEADVLTLRAELAAARGDCDEARALWQRSLDEHAGAATTEEAVLSEWLTLGTPRLPPTMITGCPSLSRSGRSVPRERPR